MYHGSAARVDVPISTRSFEAARLKTSLLLRVTQGGCYLPGSAVLLLFPWKCAVGLAGEGTLSPAAALYGANGAGKAVAVATKPSIDESIPEMRISLSKSSV